MKYTILRENERGKADYGWLKANYTFSFANYHNPNRVRFGVLRVLNDDEVAAGKGFGMHPHDNMEIISIPLQGALAHADSMGNNGTIEHGNVQVMSAGSGLEHSEFNNSETENVKLLQIWMFPNKKNVTPRYQQISYNANAENELIPIVSPENNTIENTAWIYQNAWFYIGNFNANKTLNYTLKNNKNGVFILNILGTLQINNISLKQKDSIELIDADLIEIKTTSEKNTFLLIETPIN